VHDGGRDDRRGEGRSVGHQTVIENVLEQSIRQSSGHIRQSSGHLRQAYGFLVDSWGVFSILGCMMEVETTDAEKAAA